MHKAEQVECMGLHTCRIIILVGVCFLSIAARSLKLYYTIVVLYYIVYSIVYAIYAPI